MAPTQESPKDKAAPATQNNPDATAPISVPTVHPVVIAAELPILQAFESQDRTPCEAVAMIARAKNIGTRELEFKSIVWHELFSDGNQGNHQSMR